MKNTSFWELRVSYQYRVSLALIGRDTSENLSLLYFIYLEHNPGTGI